MTANEFITAEAGDVTKMQWAWTYAAYSSASGKPTARLLANALRQDLPTLRRMCEARGIRPANITTA